MSSVTEKYILSRGFSANTRQTLQHYLWKDGLGYLLHPSIPHDSENLKVAEIGVGTGIWILELSRALPSSAQIDGLDISSLSPLQKNGSLRISPCTRWTAPPTLQAIYTIKPGGYIQWGEWDFATWDIIRVPSAAGQTNEELNKLRDYTSTLGNTKPGPNFASSNWVAQLHQIFRERGMTNVIVDRRPHPQETLTYLMDTFMVASQEISYNVLDKLGGGKGDVARWLIEEVYENRHTTAFHIDRVITVGQKPQA